MSCCVVNIYFLNLVVQPPSSRIWRYASVHRLLSAQVFISRSQCCIPNSTQVKRKTHCKQSASKAVQRTLELPCGARNILTYLLSLKGAHVEVVITRYHAPPPTFCALHPRIQCTPTIYAHVVSLFLTFQTFHVFDDG